MTRSLFCTPPWPDSVGNFSYKEQSAAFPRCVSIHPNSCSFLRGSALQGKGVFTGPPPTQHLALQYKHSIRSSGQDLEGWEPEASDVYDYSFVAIKPWLFFFSEFTSPLGQEISGIYFLGRYFAPMVIQGISMPPLSVFQHKAPGCGRTH